MGAIRRRKIYYMPGIVSLTLLVIPFAYYTFRDLERRSLAVIPVVLTDTNCANRFSGVFANDGIFPPKRDYTEIILTGNVSHNCIKLAFAQIRVREILAAKDSVAGLHFAFTDSSTYGAFVKTIDVLRAERAKHYAVLDSNVWFCYAPPVPATVNSEFTVFECRPVCLPKKNSWWAMAIVRATKVWQRSWEIILAFAAFLFSIVILRWRKGFR